MESLYPAGPTCVSGELTRPTPKYRVHAWLAMGALVAFVVMYVALTGWLITTAWRLFAATEGAGANF